MTLQALVCLKNGQPVTTSLLIAEHFNKQHKNVLRDIENLLFQAPETKPNFELCYKNNELQNGKPQPFYEITRDGFTLLAMGFTGREALRFKLDYIAAFNLLERMASSQQQSATLQLAAMRQMMLEANPVWARLIRMLKAELVTHEMARALCLSPSTVEKHLRQMRTCGLIEKRKPLRAGFAGQVVQQLTLLEG